MIPFKKINSIEDVKREYPDLCDSRLLGKSVVKKFIQEELKDLVDDELDKCAWAEEEAKPRATLEFILAPTARARALYHYLWSFEHNIDQMMKWGWKPEDLETLVKRMKAAGYDPYSREEDTAGQFIESLHGFGRKKVETKSGRTFYLYNPKGYDERETTRPDYNEH